ncbi:response regulator [Sinomonas atrocyanea]|uniref:response regulator n=1 Tax=Sinomonas atrocyanea TaxID=37927 RepID=UPI00277EB7ED|nr:response regulator [Sinomonas atrocyanea]MDQ0259529.1 DNA-binding NarL/FixJ family response regulator [Sinomonas atrocyanea]MDR6623212.1 DNA-binding NarL/FixJ family response regulator [Sinomonas atrocyanea]
MRGEGRIRVFLLSGYRPLRTALREMLGDEGMDVVGEAESAAEALPLLLDLAPDVAVLDEHLPDGEGHTLCRQLHESGTRTRCVILTSWLPQPARTPSAGGPVFLLRSIADNGVPQAIRAAAGPEARPAARVQTRPRAAPPPSPSPPDRSPNTLCTRPLPQSRQVQSFSSGR